MKRTSSLRSLSVCAVAALLTACAFLSGCQANQNILRSAPSPVPEASLEPSKTDLATDVRDMQTAGLEQIFVIRRKDGGVFDKDDRQFLRDNVPNEINRRVSSDGGKAFVFGTNFIVPKEITDKWRERFTVEERTTEQPVQKVDN